MAGGKADVRSDGSGPGEGPPRSGGRSRLPVFLLLLFVCDLLVTTTLSCSFSTKPTGDDAGIDSEPQADSGLPQDSGLLADSGAPADAGVIDSGSADTGVADGTVSDGMADGSAQDGTVSESGPPDSSGSDGAMADGAAPDATLPQDAGQDSGPPFDSSVTDGPGAGLDGGWQCVNESDCTGDAGPYGWACCLGGGGGSGVVGAPAAVGVCAAIANQTTSNFCGDAGQPLCENSTDGYCYANSEGTYYYCKLADASTTRYGVSVPLSVCSYTP